MAKKTELKRRKPMSNEEVLQADLTRLKEELAAKERQIALAGGAQVCTECETYNDPEIDCEIFNYAKRAKNADPRRFWCGFFKESN